MARLVYLDQAQDDLIAIARYILGESGSREVALGFTGLIREKCRAIAQTPGMGRSRPELRRDLRSFPFQEYLIFYEYEGDTVRIVTILHGARDIEALFRD